VSKFGGPWRRRESGTSRAIRQVSGSIDHAGLRLITCGGEYDDRRHHCDVSVVAFAALVGHQRRSARSISGSVGRSVGRNVWLVDISVSRVIDAPAEQVWSLVVDWERQSSWIPATAVRVLPGLRAGIGTKLEATTGAGPLRVTDPMEVVEWDPPWLCVMRHDGPVLRGVGIFRTRPAATGRCVFTWQEQVEVAGGRVGLVAGDVAGRLATPFFAVALWRLDRLATRGGVGRT
jgi:hypothetical protein